MKGAHFGKLRRVELRDVADARSFVGMNGERFSVDIEIEFAVRIRENSLPVFLLHHIPLRGEILIVQRERRHSFRFRPQDRLEIIRRHDFVINGHVVRGESVIFSADVFGQIVERVRRQMLVALEHHVLKEMSKTAAAVRIIFRTDVIPDLDGDGRALVIFDRVNLKPVRQRHVFEGERRNGYRRARASGLPRRGARERERNRAGRGRRELSRKSDTVAKFSACEREFGNCVLAPILIMLLILCRAIIQCRIGAEQEEFRACCCP